MVLEAWFFIAAALLVVSGGAKLWDPAPTRGALEASGLPSGSWTAPTLGVVEIVAGLGGTVLGGGASLVVGVIYLAFAGFVAYALMRKIPIQSCGCFGKAGTPPSWLHLGFNVLSVVAAVGVAVAPQPPIDLLGDQPLWAIPYLGFVALGVWVVYLLLTELPRLREAAR